MGNKYIVVKNQNKTNYVVIKHSDEDTLEHFGVKGMKWGVINAIEDTTKNVVSSIKDKVQDIKNTISDLKSSGWSVKKMKSTKAEQEAAAKAEQEKAKEEKDKQDAKNAYAKSVDANSDKESNSKTYKEEDGKGDKSSAEYDKLKDTEEEQALREKSKQTKEEQEATAKAEKESIAKAEAQKNIDDLEEQALREKNKKLKSLNEEKTNLETKLKNLEEIYEKIRTNTNNGIKANLDGVITDDLTVISKYIKSLQNSIDDVDNEIIEVKGQELKHWGILGMRWGVRRYQNADGSLTAEGRIRYGAKSDGSEDAEVIRKALAEEAKDKTEQHIVEDVGSVFKQTAEIIPNKKGSIRNKYATNYSKEKYSKMTDEELKRRVQRLNLEKSYGDLTGDNVYVKSGEEKTREALQTIGALAGIAATVVGIGSRVTKIKRGVTEN